MNKKRFSIYTALVTTFLISGLSSRLTINYTHAQSPVPNSAPTASISSQIDGTFVLFNASGSTDPDGDKLTYKWDFGENAEDVHPDARTAINEQVANNYRFPGTYTVILTVDDGRLTNTVTKEVTVNYPQTNPTNEHPFLVVKASDYPDLRNKADQEPWANTKNSAISLAGTSIAPTHWDYWFKSSDIVGANSLSYILDPTNSEVYKDTIVQLIRDGFTMADGGSAAFTDPSLLDGVVDKIGSCAFELEVRPGTFLVNVITAYDVVYNDLTTSERSELEGKLDLMVEKINCGWEWNWYSVHAVWELFKGNETEYYKWKNLYDQANAAYTFTEDGWFSGGPNYGVARFVWRRDSKYVLMDIAEHTNTGRYYSDPRYINFHEWVYGYAYTPMTSKYTFGDSGATGTINSWDHHNGHAAVRAYRFSDTAAALAALRYGPEKNINPNIFSYTFMQQAYPQQTAQAPTSRIFADGGVAFVENDYSINSLSGLLYSNTKRVWHTHSDTNALAATAYGESVLLNSGYRAPNSNFGGFLYYYTSHEARANNAVTIDEVNHKIGPVLGNGGDTYGGSCELPGFIEVYEYNSPCTDLNPPFTKRSAGIGEGFTSLDFDYATGDSGYPAYGTSDPIRVVTNGRHLRNFIFIHPQDGANGYFVALDEVESFNPATNPPTPKTDGKVNLYFHPNSGSPTPNLFWFRFDGNLDETTQTGGYSASAIGSGYSFVPNRFGQYQALGGLLEKAIDLSGTHLTVNGSENVAFSSSQFSYSVWFKTSSAGVQTMLTKSGAATESNNAKLYLDSDGRVAASFTDEFGQEVVVTDTDNIAGALNNGDWHLVAVSGRSRDMTSYYETEVNLYVDGQVVQTVKHEGNMKPNTIDPWMIGAEPTDSGVTNQFIGVIDDVRVNNRQWYQNNVDVLSNQFAGAPKEIQTNEEYAWDITGNARFDYNKLVNLTIGLGKVPINVDFPWSFLANGGSDGAQTLGYHFQADFDTDSGGRANIPTVLYPSDPTHNKPNIQRIATNDYDGLEVSVGTGITDYIVAVPFDKPIAINLQNADINARSAIFRRGSSGINYYFVRNGTKFMDTSTQVGFDSTEPVSLHFRDTTGSIVSPATELTIYDYDITSVSLDGNQITMTETTPTYAKVIVPRGTFEISYTNDGEPPPTPIIQPGDTDSDGDVDIFDYNNLLGQFGQTGSDLSADFNTDGDVDIFDYNTLLSNFGV